jgi:hypothetical protein
LLGLFTFGLFTRWTVREQLAPVVCVVSPILCWLLDVNSKAWLNGYTFGFELLILNGAVTFVGLILLRTPAPVSQTLPR